MNEQHQTGFRRATEWLSGDVRVSRKALLAAAFVLLVVAGIALD